MKRASKGLEARISKAVGRAIADYDMIQDNDRILVAVSGGKDSLTLLRMLSRRRKFVPIKFELEAIYVDLGYGMAPDIERQLQDFCRAEDVPFRVKKHDVVKAPQRGEVNCFWCAWNRRRVLFEAAREARCRKVALGHHKDDIVQTILMNLFFEGQISAMAPAQSLFKGALTLIRPLAYVEEEDIEFFVRAAGFKATRCGCAHAGMTQRAFAKDVVLRAQRVAPGVKSNIFRSLQRIKKDYLL